MKLVPSIASTRLFADLIKEDEKRPAAQASGPSGSSSRGSHRVMGANTCERYWGMSTYYGYRLQNDTPWRAIGTLIHNHLAYHYAARMETPPDWFANVAITDAQRSVTADNKLLLLAEQVYQAYLTFWAEQDKDWEIVAVEKEFTARIGDIHPEGAGVDPALDDEIISCRVDLLARSVSTGQLLIVDHKCQGIQKNFSKQLAPWERDNDYRVSLQMFFNKLIIGRAMGVKDPAFIINRVKRVEPFDFDRNVVETPGLLYEFAPAFIRNMVARERELIAKVERGEALLPNPGACVDSWGHCDYIDICTAKNAVDARQLLDAKFVQIGGLRKRAVV
jgi:hypothetical protein